MEQSDEWRRETVLRDRSAEKQRKTGKGGRAGFRFSVLNRILVILLVFLLFYSGFGLHILLQSSNERYDSLMELSGNVDNGCIIFDDSHSQLWTDETEEHEITASAGER